METIDPPLADRHRFPIQLLRPLWTGLAGVLLILVAFGVHFGVSGYQRRVTVREIKHFNGSIQYLNQRGPNWLLARMNESRMQWFSDPDHVVFLPGEANLNERSRFGGNIIPTVGPLIDDDNLKCVLGLPNLRSLDLAFSVVGNDGMKHIIGLKKLERLRLEGSDVSDKSIPLLSKMRSLKWLNVEHTRFTESGSRALEAALPGCDVRGPHNDQNARFGFRSQLR